MAYIQTKIVPDAPGKLPMAFGFEDQPQFITRERRSQLAHMMKCYRVSTLYRIKRVGLHHYQITTTGYSVVASIMPYDGEMQC